MLEPTFTALSIFASASIYCFCSEHDKSFANFSNNILHLLLFDPSPCNPFPSHKLISQGPVLCTFPIDHTWAAKMQITPTTKYIFFQHYLHETCGTFDWNQLKTHVVYTSLCFHHLYKSKHLPSRVFSTYRSLWIQNTTTWFQNPYLMFWTLALLLAVAAALAAVLKETGLFFFTQSYMVYMLTILFNDIYTLYIYIDSIPFILFHFMCAENLEFWITIGTVSRYQDFPWRQLQLFISPPQELSIAASQGLPSLITNIPTIFIQTLAYNIQGCCWRYLSCWRLLPKCTYIYIYILSFHCWKAFPNQCSQVGVEFAKSQYHGQRYQIRILKYHIPESRAHVGKRPTEYILLRAQGFKVSAFSTLVRTCMWQYANITVSTNTWKTQVVYIWKPN